MTGPSDPDGDMLRFPWPSRTDAPQIGDGVLDALLAQDLPPEETPAPLRPVTEVLAVLRVPPDGGELAGLDQALAGFRETAGMPESFRRSRPRRPALLGTLLSAKLGAAVAAAVLGGVAAAYAGALPAALQKFAHDSIDAPAASASPGPSRSASHPSATQVGPNPAGPAAYGLCTAYQHANAHGDATQRAVAFKKLAAAAGGAGEVAAYCATVPHPGTTPSGPPTSHPAKPTHAPPSHHGGKPTSVPAGKPTAIPSSAHRP